MSEALHSQAGATRAGAGLARGADLLTLTSLASDDVHDLFELTHRIKRDFRPFAAALEHKHVAMIFEKPSLRTRITFEVGVGRLGGQAIYMDQSSSRLGERESVRDYAKNLERWVHGIVARVFSHRALEQLAEHSSVPVINALSDRFHPCQALADFFTLHERLGDLRKVRLAFVGDGNNVCHSLMHAAALTGASMVVVTPRGYGPEQGVVTECQSIAASSGSKIEVTSDATAVQGSNAVYTDVWVSMGQAEQAAKRMKAFGDYQVDRDLMAQAGPQALFMHCLPAQRGVEVTDEVIDSPNSVVYDQAENRLHVQMALMLRLLDAANT